jgi:hypothetical protein
VTRAHRGAGTTNHEPITMHRVRMAAVLMSRPIRLLWLGVYARNNHSLPWLYAQLAACSGHTARCYYH